MPMSGVATSISGVAVSATQAQNLIDSLATWPGVNDIGIEGQLGFGVGICPALPAGFSAMAGTTDRASPNYGNYTYSDGSVMCWIPAFWYRIGHASNPSYAGWLLNSVDVVRYSTFANEAAANAAGYALPRAFWNAGAVQLGFFVDKYHCSANSGVASSLRYGNPLSTASAHNPIGSLTGAPANTYGGVFAAAKTRAARFFPAMRYMRAALGLLVTAHAQAAASTAQCAWWDGSATGLAGPKGCNNNALRDTADTAVVYTSDGYSNAGKTGSGVPFEKTTHNGQASGVADLNGNMWEVSPGITCVATTLTITGAALTNPARITVTAHGLSTGRQGRIDSLGGTTQLNGKIFTVTVVDANTLSLDGIDGTAFSAYTSGGTLTVGVFHALTTAADAAALTGGNALATDAWGATGLAAHSAVLDVPWAAGQVYALRYGASANQVLSPDTSGAGWSRTNLGLALPAGVGATGINTFGLDNYHQYIANELCPIAGGNWDSGSVAGVWAVGWAGARSSSYADVGFRSASYL